MTKENLTNPHYIDLIVGRLDGCFQSIKQVLFEFKKKGETEIKCVKNVGEVQMKNINKKKKKIVANIASNLSSEEKESLTKKLLKERPKPPMNTFIAYVKAQKGRIRDESKAIISIADITAIASLEWKSLPQEAKDPYIREYEEQHQEYLKAREKFIFDNPILKKIRMKKLTKKNLEKFIAEEKLPLDNINEKEEGKEDGLSVSMSELDELDSDNLQNHHNNLPKPEHEEIIQKINFVTRYLSTVKQEEERHESDSDDDKAMDVKLEYQESFVNRDFMVKESFEKGTENTKQVNENEDEESSKTRKTEIKENMLDKKSEKENKNGKKSNKKETSFDDETKRKAKEKILELMRECTENKSKTNNPIVSKPKHEEK